MIYICYLTYLSFFGGVDIIDNIWKTLSWEWHLFYNGIIRFSEHSSVLHFQIDIVSEMLH